MEEEAKRKKIQKYFEEFPRWTIVLLILGIVCILVGVKGGDELSGIATIAKIVGAVLTVSGIVGIVASQSGKPADNEIDDWLEFDRKELVTRSKAKLGLDESQIVSDPYELFVWMWIWRRTEGTEHILGIPLEDIKQKKGKTPCKYPHLWYNKVRHSAWHFEVFYPTEHHLASYGCAFDFLRGKFVSERTAEIYYKDVILLETSTYDKIDLTDKGLKKSDYETFTLKLSSGDKIEVTIPSEYFINQYLKDNLSEAPSTQCEKMVQSMRKMIQAKKS